MPYAEIRAFSFSNNKLLHLLTKRQITTSKNKLTLLEKKLMRFKGFIKRMAVPKYNKTCKENFDNQPRVQLINPAKNELGRITKLILDKTNKINGKIPT